MSHIFDKVFSFTLRWWQRVAGVVPGLILYFSLVLSSQNLNGEFGPGLITLVAVKGKVEVIHAGETHRARNGTRVTEGVTIRSAHRARAILLFANGTGILLLGNSQLTVSSFSVFPFTPPREDLASQKWEPSLSHTQLRFDRGELICEVKVLDLDSTFAIAAPFGTVQPIPNRYQFKTSFLLKAVATGLSAAAWKGNIRVKLDGGEPIDVPGDSHIFFKGKDRPKIARGLEWSYVRHLEEHLNLIYERQKKVRFE